MGSEVRTFHVVVINHGLDCHIWARKLLKEETDTEEAVGSNASVENVTSILECKWGRVGATSYFHIWQRCDDTEMTTSTSTTIDHEKCTKDIIASYHSPMCRQFPEYGLIMRLKSDLFVSLFHVESLKEDQLRDRSRACRILKLVLRAALPKGISVDRSSLLIRMHMELCGAPPYSPVNRFIINLTMCTDTGPHDFVFHLAHTFIQSLYNRARPLVIVYSAAKMFIEQLHRSTLPCCLLGALTTMFLMELFRSNLDNDLCFGLATG